MNKELRVVAEVTMRVFMQINSRHAIFLYVYIYMYVGIYVDMIRSKGNQEKEERVSVDY